MKIYTTLIVDIETGAVLQEESFEYSGPVALAKGNVSATPKSEEELGLIRTQNELLTQQLQQGQTLTPLIMKSIGMKQDDKGNWTEMSYTEKVDAMDPLEKSLLENTMLTQGMDVYGNKLTEEQQLEKMTDTEKLQYETEKLSSERYLKALKGELDISPALESELSTQETNMQETLSRKLGNDWQTSTSGLQAMANLKAKSEMIREEARQGLISDSAVTYQNQLTNALNKQTTETGLVKNSNQTNLANLLGVSNMYTGQGSSGLTSLMDSFAADRDVSTSASMQTSANKAANRTGMYTLGGTALTAAAVIAYAV